MYIYIYTHICMHIYIYIYNIYLRIVHRNVKVGAYMPARKKLSGACSEIVTYPESVFGRAPVACKQ